MSFFTFICIGFLILSVSNGDIIQQKEAEVAGTPSNFLRTIYCILSNIVYPIFRVSLPDVNYLLFTPKNPNDACDLQPNTKSLQKCNFNPNAQTVVLVHGWNGGLPEDDLKFVIKDKLLGMGDYNVVVHNWTFYTHLPSPAGITYPIDSVLTVFIGLRIAAWIKFLQKEAGAKPELFHLNGHSLGAHVVSFAGKTTCNLGRITFLDAAGPLFRFLPKILEPSYTDAILTQAIHSSGAYTALGGDGLENPYAHIDYYPNGGSQQPKCFFGAKFRDVENEENVVDSPISKTSCNHNSPYEYYLALLNQKCHFLGLICENYEDYKSGKCNPGNSVQCEMNFDPVKLSSSPPKSQCYFTTSSKYPYCLN